MSDEKNTDDLNGQTFGVGSIVALVIVLVLEICCLILEQAVI